MPESEMFGRGSRALSFERDEMMVFARPAPFTSWRLKAAAHCKLAAPNSAASLATAAIRYDRLTRLRPAGMRK
jgi:hypothetical protein